MSRLANNEIVRELYPTALELQTAHDDRRAAEAKYRTLRNAIISTPEGGTFQYTHNDTRLIFNRLKDEV